MTAALPPPHDNGWSVWSKLVLKTLTELDGRIDKLVDQISRDDKVSAEDITKLRIEVAKIETTLKVKCSAYGAGAGTIIVIARELIDKLS